MNATLVSFATYQDILRMREFGLAINLAEQISEAVWEVPTPWTYKDFHRSSQWKVVGFKG